MKAVLVTQPLKEEDRMEDKRATLGSDLALSEILDVLEEAEWTFVGEVEKLVHPNDTGLLRQLLEECDRRLQHVREVTRRRRLTLIRKQLHTTAELNAVLPMVVHQDPFQRTGKSAPGLTRKRKRSRRMSTALPGFQAYHNKLMEWLDDNGLAQNGLAQYLDVDPSYLSRAIRGERKNRDLFLKIEDLTGIAAPYVPDDDEDADGE